MNPIATHTAAFMESHPHPALRLGELLPPMADRVDRSLTLLRLREALSEHPETFRILDPWKGPWRTVVPAPSEVTGVGAGHESRHGGHGDPAGDVWVVLLADPSGDPGPAGGAQLTLRESVRWLARCIDARSPLSVSRWYAIALAERESRRALTRRVA
ncbi:MAG: hypothetical protein U5R14_10210 [Gemmatimonadota bacterium]|nr:hypothetical protein [Gemmatimonadota bacterium]